MCGFAGVISKVGDIGRRATADVLRVFEPLLRHRGPDERGVHIDDSFGVVHRRLSIIDRSLGHQPMLSCDGQVGLAYNGEIYNHQALRSELETKGHLFTTHCDTEVVLRMFIEYGPASFNRLDGMFAIFLWDKRAGGDPVFYLVRDHFGTKPLYVYEDSERVTFSSELRPLLALPQADLALDPAGLQSYLTFRYTQAPGTFYKRIRRVEAGGYWKLEKARLLRTRYWDLPNRVTPLRIDGSEARDELVRLLRTSVAAQQMSEVPVGLLLSGGLDSSIIACLCCDLSIDLTSFNIGFPTVNEFAYSGEIAHAFELDHVTVTTTVSDIVNRFERVIDAIDEPIADPACFPLHILCDEIKKSVTVVLSGEGSDEMFAGYPQYLHVLKAEPEPSAAQLERFLRHSWYFIDEGPELLPMVDSSRRLRHSSYFSERPLLEGMLAYDMKTWLPENLMMKTDKILMSHSLEGRFPFLAKAIVEFAYALPEAMKIGPDGGKHLLRTAFSKSLPSNILKRPKMGFSVPIDLLVAELKDLAYVLLDAQGRGGLAEYLDFRELRRIHDAHYSGVRPNGLLVWSLMVMLQWFSAGDGVRARPAGGAHPNQNAAITAGREWAPFTADP